MTKDFEPNPQVLARMAEAFAQNSIIKKTYLHFSSRTDWNSFEKYLNWLQSKNYIEYHDSNVKAYKLTHSGREMFNMILNLYTDIKKFRLMIST